MEKFYKYAKLTNAIIIIAYLVLYIIGFNDFDDSGMASHFQRDDFEIYFYSIMLNTGLSFCLALAGFAIMRHKDAIGTMVINLICCIAQLPLMLGVAYKANNARGYTISAHDKTCEFHCNVTIVMSYAIMALVVIYVIMLVLKLISALNGRKSVQKIPDIYTLDSNKKKSYVHVPVLAAWVPLVVGCNYFYNKMYRSSSYEIVDILRDSMEHLIILWMPAVIILSTVVKGWIENQKYVYALGAYAIYMYMAYCFIVRVYDGKLDEYIDAFNYTNYAPMVTYTYIAVVVVAIVILGVKMLANKKQKAYD